MIIAIVLIMVLVVLGGGYFAFNMAFLMSKNRTEDVYKLPRSLQTEAGKYEMRSLIDEMNKIPFEPVTIKSYDGLKLFGRYYHVKDNAPLQIQFHGYKSYGIRDFCGGNKIARERGHNTLIVDHRSHGQSEGRVITFGIKESRDCVSWAEYAKDRFGEEIPVFLAGISMGAASVLMASGHALPKNVKGIIADCPFSRPAEIIKFSSNDMNLPKIVKTLSEPFAIIGARIFGGFGLNSNSAEEAVVKTRVPIMIIHGENDKVVPYEMSKKVYEANPSMITWVSFPEAGHGLSYIVDKERYKKLTNEFLDKCLEE